RHVLPSPGSARRRPFCLARSHRRSRRQHRRPLFGAGGQGRLPPGPVGSASVWICGPGCSGSSSSLGGRDPLAASAAVFPVAGRGGPTAPRQRRGGDGPRRGRVRGGGGTGQGRRRQALSAFRSGKTPLSRGRGVLLELPGSRGGDGRATL